MKRALTLGLLLVSLCGCATYRDCREDYHSKTACVAIAVYENTIDPLIR